MASLGPAVARKRLTLTQSGMGMMGGSFLIDGRPFDMDRVDYASTAGDVEDWEIANQTMMDHPIHVHGTQFQLVSRGSGAFATPAPYAAWIDTVDVPSGTTATIRMRQDMPGKRMVHCHILEHEDAGMMAVLEVRPR